MRSFRGVVRCDCDFIHGWETAVLGLSMKHVMVME